jgi:NAD(P)-dependent dehydrogenase (short-subunit alcohol dehydrogenase family)
MLERSKAGDAGGSLIVTSSMVAYQGAARNEAYGASKNGVIGLVQGVAVEYARHGIRCNAILPGWVESEMTGRAVADEKFNTNVIGRVPSRRWGQPEEFAGIAVYLASDASSFHTGDSILIDGGYAIF